MTAADLANYRAPRRDPTHVNYRGYDVFGMAPPSSGGSTVGEGLNILEGFDLSGADRPLALHRYLEADRLAYADRNRYVGDPDFVDVPLAGLLNEDFAAERRCLIGPSAAASPVAPGDPTPPFSTSCPASSGESAASPEGTSTNHLTVADRWGNVVSYTNTIEQIAGSGILLPGRGFLLNNELTDFNFEIDTANSVEPNKRPRSSMSPTIVTRNGRVVEAIGSPGGSTIITTVMQTLLNQIDFGMSLPEAIDAPRANQPNASMTNAEQGFIDAYGAALTARGESFKPMDYIGIVAAVALKPGGRMQTATESWRGGGGSAMVVHPDRSRDAKRR
jgi:gamma-glutamyltranspeptidase / glutathione hydrolase